MTIRAYFDDAGTHAGSEVTLIGGLVATEATWAAVEAEWRVALADFKDRSPRHFHAADCLVAGGEFGRLEVPFRRRAFMLLSNIVARHEVQPISSAIAPDDWDAIGDAPVKRICGDPFEMCFHDVIRETRAWSDRCADGAPVAIVFSEQQDQRKAAHRAYDVYARHPAWGNFLRSFTFALAKNCVPLQAADLMAWLLYRDWKRTTFPKSAADILATDEPLSRIWNARGLRGCTMHTKDTLSRISIAGTAEA